MGISTANLCFWAQDTKEVPLGFELSWLDSKAKVLTITPTSLTAEKTVESVIALWYGV